MLKVDILSWEKFNPRQDRTNFTWFRFQNNFFENHALFDLNDADRVIFLFLLCTASKKGISEVEINVRFISALLKKTEHEIRQSLQSLAKSGVIVTSESRHDDGEAPSKCPSTIQDHTIQDHTKNLSTGSSAVVQSEQSRQESLPVVQKSTPVKVETAQELISKIPQVTKQRWQMLYNDPEFLERELLKALNYYEANPRKMPKTVKGWTQALSSWFARGWDWRAKNIQGKKPAEKTDIGAILRGESHDDSTEI